MFNKTGTKSNYTASLLLLKSMCSVKYCSNAIWLAHHQYKPPWNRKKEVFTWCAELSFCHYYWCCRINIYFSNARMMCCFLSSSTEAVALSVCAVFAEWFFAFEMLVDDEGKLSFWQAEGWGSFAQVHHLMVGVPCPSCPVSSAEAFAKMCPTTRKVGGLKRGGEGRRGQGKHWWSVSYGLWVKSTLTPLEIIVSPTSPLSLSLARILLSQQQCFSEKASEKEEEEEE